MYHQVVAVVFLLVVHSAWAGCEWCSPSAQATLKGGTKVYLKVYMKQELLRKNNVVYLLGSVRAVAKGQCQLADTNIIIRVNEPWGNTCKRPSLRMGETYALPLDKLAMKVPGYSLPVFRVRVCNFYQIWDKLSASDASYLKGSHCSGTTRTPRPSTSTVSPSPTRLPPKPTSPPTRPAPSPPTKPRQSPSPTAKPTNSPPPMGTPPSRIPEIVVGTPPRNGSCPKVGPAGLKSPNNLECGPTPTRKDISLGPSDNIQARLKGVPAGAYVYLAPGTYNNGVFDIKVNDRVTVWALPGKVSFNGGTKGTAFQGSDAKDVRIFGIRFVGYRPKMFNGVIQAPTQSGNDPFNGRADPLWGYNPPNNWVVDCCVFDGWQSEKDSKSNAVTCGSGMTIRGCQFLNGEGLGIYCLARDVAITGNRFIGIQMKKPFFDMHCGALKIMIAKRFYVANNYFKDIGCKAIWCDNNCEQVYVGYNEGYNIGKSFVHFEISGSRNVAEQNKIVGFGWGSGDGPGKVSWLFHPAIYITTGGGNDGPPSSQGNIVRWNHVDQVPKTAAARVRSGIVDMDQSTFRNYDKSQHGGQGPWGSPRFGRIPDAGGSANPGIRERRSAYNQFYGNTVRGVPTNGIYVQYPKSARPDLTDIWTCNDLSGEFRVIIKT